MKKIFAHNKDLDKVPITIPLNKVNLDEGFYPSDKEELEQLMPKDKRTSTVFFREGQSDELTFRTLIKILTTTDRYLSSSNKVSIMFNELQGENWASMDGNKVNVSLAPLFDHRIGFYSRLNSIFAVSYHESWHIRYTTPGIGNLLMKRGLTTHELTTSGLKTKTIPDYKQIDKIFSGNFHKVLNNIVEDKRIERKGLTAFPGFVYYFDDLRKYCLYMHMNAIENPKEPVDYTNPDHFYSALTFYITYSYLLPEVMPYFNKTKPDTKEFKELTDKVDTILATNVLTFEDSLYVASQLLNLYPKDQQEKQAKKFGGGSGTKPQIIKGTFAEGEGLKLSKEQLEQLTEIFTDELEYAKEEEVEIDKRDRHTRDTEYETLNIKPAPIKPLNRAVYNEALKISKSIAKNLAFINTRLNKTNEVYEVNHGEIDEDMLHVIKHSRSIFVDEEIIPGYELDFGILIDESGSMYGDKIQKAQVAALGLALALRDESHINLYVYGHTANTDGAPIMLYKYFDSKDKRMQNLNTMFSIESRANNADGYAINHMGTIMKKSKARNKVLVVISDGQPNAQGYGGSPAISHVNSIVSKLESQGIFVIQVAIDSVDSDKMFKHYIPYNAKNPVDLGVSMRKILGKKLIEITNSMC